GQMRNHIRKTPPRKERFEINEAVNEVIAMVRSEIAKNRIGITTNLVDGPAPVHGDRVQVQQVVVNLILNAVEAMASVEVGDRQVRGSSPQAQDNAVLVGVGASVARVEP